MVATPIEPSYAVDPALAPLRARPAGTRAALSMGLGASLLLGAAAFGARHAAPATATEPTVKRVATVVIPAEPRPVAQKIAAKAEAAPPALPTRIQGLPFSAFDLNAPEFANEKKTIAVRDGDEGVGRVDALTLGQFAMGVPFLRLDIHQDISEKEADSDFFLDMTRHASLLGLNAAKISQPAAISTRFGEFEVADIRLTQPASEGVAASERACLVARMIKEAPSLEITAIACGAANQKIDRPALGCLFDRLEFKAGEKTDLNEYFAAAETERGKACNYSREDVTASIPAHKPAGGGRARRGAHRAAR